MPYPSHLLPTTVVGSYPQPAWLVDHDAQRRSLVPRIHAPGIWRVAAGGLEAAQDDATALAIRDMERAGIDIVTDGEIRRESYSNRFALALAGIDATNPAEMLGRSGGRSLYPRITGPIRRTSPVEVRDAAFLCANATRATKITLPGPFTLAMQAKDEHYGDDEAVAMAYAEAVNAELRDLKATGVDVVQLDEPWLQARPEQARRYGVRAINRALAGIAGPTVLHVCFGYAAAVSDKPSGYSCLSLLADTAADQVSIEAAQPDLDAGMLRDLGAKTVILGVIDLSTPIVEEVGTIVARVRRALGVLPAEQIVLAPDCGMKFLPRAAAFGKLRAMAEAAALLRLELAG